VFPPGSTHSTFNANPMGTAIGLEAMKLMSEVDYAALSLEKGAYFLSGLRELQRKFPEIGDVDGLGLALRVEVCEADGHTPNKKLVDRLAEEGLKGDLEVDRQSYGLVLDVGGYHKNVLTLAPALTITRGEIDLALRLLESLFVRCLHT